MIAKKKADNQLNFLCPTLREQLNPNNELYPLNEPITWAYFEEAFKDCYSDKGRPSHPTYGVAADTEADLQSIIRRSG